MAYSVSDRRVSVASVPGVSGFRSLERLTYFQLKPESVSVIRIAAQNPSDMAKNRTQYCLRPPIGIT